MCSPRAKRRSLDRDLPQYDVTETHAVIIDADTDRTWQAVRRSDLSRSAVIRVLLQARSLPNRLRRALKGRPTGSGPPAVDPQGHGARLVHCSWANRPATRSCSALSCNRGRRSPTTSPRGRFEPGRFAAFDTPGYVKVAFNIRVKPYGSGRTLITTETRTAATDPASLRRFARYWLLACLFTS